MVALNYFFFTVECKEAVFFCFVARIKSEDIDQVQETVSKFQWWLEIVSYIVAIILQIILFREWKERKK